MLKVDQKSDPGLDPAARKPLCVNLEDTAVLSDLRFELLLRLLRTRPIEFLRLPQWLLSRNETIGGALGEGLVDWTKVPLNQSVMKRLEVERQGGRPIVLLSSFDQGVTEALASTMGVVDLAVGSRTGGGAPDERALEAKFPEGFEVLSPGEGRRSGGGLRAWLRTLRIHQWAKNVLVFVPVLLEGPHVDVPKVTAAVLALFMLNCFASAGYIVNDVLDVDADRRSHQSKRSRPFASGALRTRYGLAAVPMLLLLGCICGAMLPLAGFAIGIIYFASSTLYSVWLKRVPMLDVVVLAWLFTIRILTGIFAADLVISYWLLTFSMFFFLNLAIIKRYAELIGTPALGAATLERRGYSSVDMPLLLAAGSGSALASASIFVSYLLNEQFPKNVYSTPASLWLIFPILLFWMLRAWHETVHGRMNMDPVLYALRDRMSQLLGVLVAICLWLAW